MLNSGSKRRFRAPVMILGAPRSGTSLLHRILRGHPGFASTARESQPVWQPLTHPARHGWQGEMAPDKLTDSQIAGIHRQLAGLALPAQVWRRADARDVVRKQQNPFLSRAVLRPGYWALTRAKGLLWRRTLRYRLVDKSVHSGLWPDLLDDCFPDARYIHIVRDPRSSIGSMVDGWLDPNRFFTYTLPTPLAIPDYPYSAWNFPLPRGWSQVTNKPLADVVAFQWRAIQEGVLAFERECPPERFMRIRLEDLSSRPFEVLSALAEFLGLEWSPYLDNYAASVPVVNARPGTSTAARLQKPVEDVLPDLKDLAGELGY